MIVEKVVGLASVNEQGGLVNVGQGVQSGKHLVFTSASAKGLQSRQGPFVTCSTLKAQAF